MPSTATWCFRSQAAQSAPHGLAGTTGSGVTASDVQTSRLFGGDAPGAPDFESAIKWARKAAAANSPEGQAILAYALTYGPGPLRDLDDAHRWYERSAAAGCPQGDLGYALSLARRATDEASRRRIAEHLRRASTAKLSTA
jgi:uncharacterized protein